MNRHAQTAGMEGWQTLPQVRSLTRQLVKFLDSGPELIDLLSLLVYNFSLNNAIHVSFGILSSWHEPVPMYPALARGQRTLQLTIFGKCTSNLINFD